jgi:phage I-like protein
MSFYGAKGVELALDYEHQALQPKMKAPAAGWYELALRDGELWAVNVRWTPVAQQHLRMKEYRYFSPAFNVEEKTNRVARLINIALTNLPAMDQLEPLVAATQDTGDTTMTEAELKARIAALETENAGIKTQLAAAEGAKSTVVSLSTVVGLADAPADKVRAEVVALTAFRGEIRKLTGKDSDEGALGAVQAMKASNERVAELEKAVAAERTIKLTAEFSGILDKASTDGKITPAQRPFWDGQAKDLGVEKALSMLKGFVETAPVIGGSGDPIKPPAGTVALSQVEIDIATRTGSDVEALKKFKATKLGGASA